MNRRRFLAAGALFLAGCRAPRQRAAFPPLALRALEGPGTLAADGLPLLVNYWATWCGPCRAEMASLDRLARQLAGRIRVVGVSVDEDLHLAREWLRRSRIGFANYADPGMRASRVPLGIAALPETFLVGADWTVLERIRGAREWDAPELAAAVVRRARA